MSNDTRFASRVNTPGPPLVQLGRAEICWAVLHSIGENVIAAMVVVCFAMAVPASAQDAGQPNTKHRSKHAMPGMQSHEVHTPVADLRNTLVAAWNAGDVNKLAGLYSESAGKIQEQMLALLDRKPRDLSLAVLGGVVQLNGSARPLLVRINNAGIEGARIHMQAHRPLVEFSRVIDAMDGFQRIYRCGIFRVHLYDVGGFDFALAACIVLPEDAVILNQKPADRRGHPAVLIAMIVNRTHLTYLPADSDQLK